MGLSKTSLSYEIKSDGNTFHELFKLNPHTIPDASPDLIKACNVHQGEFGTPGSIISWDYFLDGKECHARQTIDVDEEKRSVSYIFIEGDLMEYYKTLKISCHVDENGETSLVTWTYEFEKLNEEFPNPEAVVGKLLGDLTKDVEAHHLKEPTA